MENMYNRKSMRAVIHSVWKVLVKKGITQEMGPLGFKARLWSQTAWIQISSLLPSILVTLGSILIYKMGRMIEQNSESIERIHLRLIHIKFLEEYLRCCCCLVTRSCQTLCDSMDCSLPGSSCQDFPGKNTGVGCHFLSQGIFPTHVSCIFCTGRQVLYQLSLTHSKSSV